ncbi:FG-GAP-like repeat-containing protein [Hymenobacter artigasi]|uniref:Staphylococcus aureus surface protein A n=1 Tax=Hymenobacter artigasi TaxID=2719616 RepID=A0ABX1HFF9_9BACT|nr:LamG-like jellyroll fold domain-containing protein [Hymenobacter artigasi]NKI87817.1 hypothetical protein [Hymenobacter artigasi]
MQKTNTHSWQLARPTRSNPPLLALVARLLLTLLLGIGLVPAAMAQAMTFTANGDASVQGGNCYTITPNAGGATGSMFSNSTISLAYNFDLNFTTTLGGADGIAFVLQNGAATVNPGQSGSNLNYYGGGGIVPSVAVELDTYNSGTGGTYNDNDNSHLALVKNSSSTPLRYAAISPNLNFNGVRTFRVTWNVATTTLTVFLDGIQQFSYVDNLASTTFGGSPNVRFGFTGACGGAAGQQTVCVGTLTYVLSPLKITSLSPARNAKNVVRTSPVGITFDQAVNAATAGNARVFSSQRGGQLARGGNATASGSTLTVTPAQALRPGETAFVTVPASVQSSSGGAALPHVYQFTAAAAVAPAAFPASASVTVAAGTNPRSAFAADVNGDGHLDLLVANQVSNTVSVRFNNGSGFFSGGSNVAVGPTPFCVTAADVDGDGDLDILTANLNASGTVSVRFNDGSGVFSGTTEVPVGSQPQFVTAADVDGDGDVDILTANYNSQNVSIRLNDGSGSFGGGSDVATAAGGYPVCVTAADVDGDGDLDFLVANSGGTFGVSVRLNNGSGSFSGTTNVAAGAGTSGVVAADVDGDGDLDILAANSSAGTVSVRLNNGSGVFSGGSDVTVGANAQSVAAADVDGDGDLDILTSNAGSNSASVRLNDGVGNYSGSTNLAVGTQPQNIIAADLDSDGDLDILVSNFSTNNASVLLNQAAAPVITSFSPTPAGTGIPVTLTGTSLSGTTSLSINGAAATILTNTATAITFRVPAGATATGTSSVTTPGGTATSTAFTALLPPGNALAFDGTDDYVSIPNTAALSLTTNFTIETWIKPTGTGNNTQNVVCKSSTTAGTGYIFPRTDDTWQNLRIWLNKGGSWSHYTVPYGAAYFNQWHHVAASYDGSTVRIYIDGVAVTPTLTGGSAITGPISTNTNPLTLGAQPGLSTEFYSGGLDEVRLYNTVLTAAQVQSDMLSTAPAVLASLVAYYNFDEGTPAGTNTGLTTLYDVASTNHGTLTNFALTGTTSNWVESYALVVPTATAATSITTSGFTANWTAPALGTVDNGYRVDVSTGSTFASVISGSPFTASSGTSLAIAGLAPGTTYYYRVRANKTSVTGQGDNSSVITAATCALPVAIAQNATVTLSAGGNATLAATAVNNGSTANCGAAAAGSLSVSPSTFTCASAVPATVAQALSFNGSTQYVEGTNASLPLGNAARTIEAWVYPTAANSSGAIFNYGTPTDNQRAGLLLISGKLYYVGENHDLSGATTLSLNTWHHVAATYDGTTLRLYVDGVADGSTVPGAFVTTGTVWRIAQRSYPQAGEFLTGAVDEVRVWNVARTAAQISSNKSIGLPGATAGLVAYYRLNEGSGTTVADATASASTGTLYNTPTWTTAAAPVVNGTPVTLTVTDASGNTSTAPALVTVTDNIAPTAVAQNVTVALSASGTAPVTAAAVNNGSTDNCAVQTLELFGVEKVVNGTFDTNATGWTAANVDGNGGYRSTGGNPGGMYILNDNGNSTTDPTLSQTVTGLTVGATYLLRGSYENFYNSGAVGTPAFAVDLNGTQLSTFPNPGVVWTPFSLRFTATATSHTLAFRGEIGTTDIDIAIDNISLLQLTPTFTCANLGANTVVLVATDASGNQSSATAIVTVTDNIAPVFAACGAGTPASPFTNLSCAKGVATGTYTFSIGGNTFLGYVDGTTDGGGWVEILNYVHQGGTNPVLNARTTSLPVQTSAALGTDESATAAWGHAAPALVAAMNPLEVRFYGQTSAHARIIHFKTSLAGVLSYLKTGTGSMTGIGSSFTALPGHTANLPAATVEYFTNQGTSAATEFPFWKSGTYHWGIKGLSNRWEVDDYPNGPGASTVHRMFVRGSATAVAGASVAANAAAGQCGATVTLAGTQAVSDNCTATVTYSPASGSFFAVGTTTVTATATDASGNTSSSSFPVTVTDNLAPAAAGSGPLPAAPVLATSNVPEAGGYGVLYQLDVPNVANFNALAAVPYTVNNAGAAIANPARVAYFMELNDGTSTKWVWASMDNFAANLTQLGIPNPTANNKVWSQSVANLNVFASSNAGVTTGTSLGTGRIEMWRWNYGTGNSDNVPGASGSTYDFGDQVSNNGDYGSFQVHNVTAGQTLLAYNNWGGTGSGGGIGNIGIGSQAVGIGHPDWTFQYNASSYTVKRIYILVPNNSAFTQPATVALNAAGSATVTNSQVYTGATDNCGVSSVVVTPNTFSCAQVGTVQTVAVAVSDASGNTTTQSAFVTVTSPAPTVATWLGTSSSSWTDCSNWQYGTVPSATTDVVIPVVSPATYPLLATGTGAAKSLTLASGASLTVASGATLQVNGDWTNNGGTATLTGTVAFVGTGATQALGGTASTAFSTVVVNKASGTVQLGQTLTINAGLTLTSGTLTTTASYQVNMGSSAAISESETSYVNGKVVMNRVLTAGAAQAFSGLGLTLTPAAGSTAPGSTLLTRVTGTALTGAGTSQSVQRYFDIQPAVNTGLNVTLAFAYFTHELNGIAVANLAMYKSTTALTGPWQQQRSTTAGPNVVTKTGISDFSIWTLGNTANPLPVELSDFTATLAGKTAVQLKWATASEKNSAFFDVERSLDGRAFERLGTVAAAGSSTAPKAYALLDGKLPAGQPALYYRLRQVDLDGTATYSVVRSVALSGETTLALYPNPAHAAATLTGAQPGTLVTVFDALGRQVTAATADATGTAALALPTGLASGVYVVRSGPHSLRLVVE